MKEVRLDTSEYSEVHWIQAGMKHQKQFPSYERARVFATGLVNRKNVTQVLVRQSIPRNLVKK